MGQKPRKVRFRPRRFPLHPLGLGVFPNEIALLVIEEMDADDAGCLALTSHRYYDLVLRSFGRTKLFHLSERLLASSQRPPILGDHPVESIYHSFMWRLRSWFPSSHMYCSHEKKYIPVQRFLEHKHRYPGMTCDGEIDYHDHRPKCSCFKFLKSKLKTKSSRGSDEAKDIRQLFANVRQDERRLIQRHERKLTALWIAKIKGNNLFLRHRYDRNKLNFKMRGKWIALDREMASVTSDALSDSLASERDRIYAAFQGYRQGYMGVAHKNRCKGHAHVRCPTCEALYNGSDQRKCCNRAWRAKATEYDKHRCRMRAWNGRYLFARSSSKYLYNEFYLHVPQYLRGSYGRGIPSSLYVINWYAEP